MISLDDVRAMKVAMPSIRRLYEWHHVIFSKFERFILPSDFCRDASGR